MVFMKVDPCGYSKNVWKIQLIHSLVHRVCVTEEDDPQYEGKLMMYFQIVNYFPDTYTTDDVITKSKADITNFKEPEEMFALRYSEVL